MASNGKLEARITVPSGGWAFAITEAPANSATITIPAGTYYHSTADSAAEGLAATIATLIAAAVTAADLVGTYTVAVAATENGTGRYTITATGITSFSIAWTDSELQDLLGFTSTPSGALTYTSESQAQALWIASYGHQKLNGSYSGDAMVSDQQTAINSAGYVYSVMGQYYRTAQIRWPQEARAKCWAANENTTNESFQTFLLGGIWGTAAWGTSAGPIRFHNDAGDDDNYGTFSVLGMERWSPESMEAHWTGRWILSLPMLIEVPGSRLDAANVAPEAGFTTEVSGLTATVTDTSTDSDGTIASRSMDWGDGGAVEPLAGTGPWEHEYASVDTYTLTLTVTDDGGLTDDFSDDVTTERATIGVSLLTSGGSTTDGTSVSTTSVDPADDAAVYACVIAASSADVATQPTCTGNGLTWVHVAGVGDTGSNRVQIDVFRAMGAAPTAGAITFDYGAESPQSFSWHVIQCTNADTSGTNASGATVQATTAATTTNPVTGTLSALEHANNVHLAIAVHVGLSTGWAADADFTALAEEVIGAQNQVSYSQWGVNQTVCATTSPAVANGACILSIEVKAG